jgi:hypothetical protein
MMKMKTIEYASSKHILAIPDHYVALGATHEKATAGEPGLAVLVDGRYIVKAGTVYTSANLNGLVLNDYDVTDGDAAIAVLVHGFVKEQALPAVVSADNKAKMPLIHFVAKNS